MNTSTGIFTTPHTGLYSINVVVHKENNTSAGRVYLVIDGKSVGYTVGRGYVLDNKMSVSRITPTEIEKYMYDIMDNKIQARMELSRIHIFEDQTLPLRYQ